MGMPSTSQEHIDAAILCGGLGATFQESQSRET